MKYAKGGLVKGPSKDDSIPVVLSPGQYEISLEAFKKYGPKLLDALNKANCKVTVIGEDDDDQST